MESFPSFTIAQLTFAENLSSLRFCFFLSSAFWTGFDCGKIIMCFNRVAVSVL